MRTKKQAGRIAWVCGYPAHYFRELHRLIESEYPGRTRFFYIEPDSVDARQRSYEMGSLPNDAQIVRAGCNRQLLRGLKEFAPSLVITSGHFPRLVARAAVWARLKGIKVAYLSDTNILDISRKPTWWRLMKRALFGFYLRQMWCLLPIGAPNKQFYEWCCGWGRTQARSVHFPLPHRAELFHEASDTAAMADRNGKIVLLYLGRLSPEKGLRQLIEGLARVPASLRSKFHCLIAGEGICRTELTELARKRGVEDAVDFLGAIPSAETPAIFRRCDVFILPSQWEPWGLVVNEALSSAKPVMAPKWVGAVPDLVHDGVTGFVLPDNAPESISEGLQRVYNERSRLKKMGLRGREIITKGGWEIEGALSGWAEIVRRLDLCVVHNDAQQDLSNTAVAGGGS